MTLFFKYVGEHLRKYPQVTLSKTDEIAVRDLSMSYLRLENINHLRDRYEGQAFFEKTMRRVGALLVCQRHLKLPNINLPELNLENFQPRLDIDGEIIDIHVFDFGTLPLLNERQIKNPILFVLRKENLKYSICGWINPNLAKSHLINATTKVLDKNSTKNFVGFNFLNNANTLIENLIEQ